MLVRWGVPPQGSQRKEEAHTLASWRRVLGGQFTLRGAGCLYSPRGFAFLSGGDRWPRGEATVAGTGAPQTQTAAGRGGRAAPDPARPLAP